MRHVLIADDHAVTRHGLRQLLCDAFAAVQVVEVGDGDAVLAALPSQPWDLLLLDVMMPGPGILELLRAIRAANPNVPVLVLTASNEIEYVIETMKSLQSDIPHLIADAPTRFRQVAESHPLWRHPFVERCRTGQLTLAQVRVLGAQMYKFCHQFPSFLGLALVACPNDEARIVIGENLWEELGEGDPQRAHAALFRQFTRALGLSDAQLSAVPALPGTTELIDTYLKLSDRFGVLGILGALCYASEGIVAALYSHIQGALQQATPFDRDALMFFEVHIHDGRARFPDRPADGRELSVPAFARAGVVGAHARAAARRAPAPERPDGLERRRHAHACRDAQRVPAPVLPSQ